MNIDENIIKTLKIIYLIFQENNVKSVLIGSISLALQGVNVKPEDIDILVDEKDIQKVSELLNRYEIKPIKFSKSKFFESHIGEYIINNVKVEVMAGLKENRCGVWKDLTTRLYKPKYIKLDNLLIPVSSLKDQLESYENTGRKKDYNKIIKIKETLKRQNLE